MKKIVLDRHIQAIDHWWANRFFWKAYCPDCREYKLQSFNEADVRKMARIHYELTGHEVEVLS